MEIIMPNYFQNMEQIGKELTKLMKKMKVSKKM